jgi:DnaK suppressor protein
MIGRKSLLRLFKSLQARKDRLHKKLAAELANLHQCKAADNIRDSADLAMEAGGGDISSRLAELDDSELGLIERALARWEQGKYGTCDGGSRNCQKTIPVARLNALPYAPFCINCEREGEQHRGGRDRQATGNWGRIADTQVSMQDQRINVSVLERDMSGIWGGGLD